MNGNRSSKARRSRWSGFGASDLGFIVTDIDCPPLGNSVLSLTGCADLLSVNCLKGLPLIRLNSRELTPTAGIQTNRESSEERRSASELVLNFGTPLTPV